MRAFQTGSLFAAVLLAAGGVPAADGTLLRLERQPPGPELLLVWDGPGPQFDVFRSLDPASFPAAPVNALPVDGLSWTDPAPPAGGLLFYRVDSLCDSPRAEACNGLDDDCDDLVDEDFDLQTDPTNCGACGNVCDADRATMGCSGGECVILDCEPGWGDANGDPSDGCEFRCEAPGTDAPDDAFLDTDCDGVDGHAAGAIFVAPSGDDADPGTRALPMRTLQAGVDRAAAEGKDVYVSLGLYDGSLELRPGVGVYGAYDRNDDWARAADHVTVIDGEDRAVRGSGADGAVLDHFTIRADLPGAAPLGSSVYGVHLEISSGVALSNLLVNVGDAKAGAPGASGVPGDPGGNGAPGQPGCEDSTFACNTCSRPAGGAGGSVSCGRSGGGGGRPGKGSDNGDFGAPGVGGAAGGPPGRGDGAQCGTSGDGGPGVPGAAGSPGSPGGAGAGLGLLDVLYTPSDGQTGTAGQDGDGGGGGGGGGGGTDVCDSWGSSGGGGGAGGCAGGPGLGGGGGGGSFALYLFDSEAVVRNSTLIAGDGGDGGAGGPGGPGGRGGAGGAGGPYGGDGDQDDASCGGPGGNGGPGGDGGPGGGGGGGPSAALVLAGASSADTSGQVLLLPGSPGAGGASAGLPGAPGVASEVLP